jgi:hypothetical protein
MKVGEKFERIFVRQKESFEPSETSSRADSEERLSMY